MNQLRCRVGQLAIARQQPFPELLCRFAKIKNRESLV